MRILSTIQPTKNQLKVLAIIAANQEKPNIAVQQLSHDQNLIAARNLLMQWNAIEFGQNKASLTDTGTKIATDNNIIDDSGQLTDMGQKLLPQDVDQPQGADNNTPVDLGAPPTDEMGDEMGLGGLPPEQPPMEGFSKLFKSALLG